MRTRSPRLTLVSALAVGLLGASPVLLPAQTPAVRTLSLDEAIALGTGSSEEVKIAEAGVTRAEGNQEIARSQYLPQINLTAGYTRTLMSQYSGLTSGSSQTTDTTQSSGSGGTSALLKNLPFGQANQYSIALTLSQTIFAGGRLTAQSDAAAARRRSADIDLTAAQAQLLLNITQSYYDAVLSDQLVTIADSSLAEADTLLKHTELAFRVGAKPEFEMLRAQVSRDNQLPVLLQRRNDRALAYYRLKEFLNIPLDDSLRLTSGVNDLSPRFNSQADTTTDQRASVRQAVENIQASEAQVRLAGGERLPAISLTSRYAPVAYPENIFPGFDDFRTDWTVGINLSIPIFTGGRIGGNEKVAEAGVTEAQARLRQTREAAELDARVSLNTLAQAEATLAAIKSTVTQAERTYQIAEVRYNEGISTQIEVSDARLLRDQALANQARAQRDFQVARVKMALLRDLPLSASGAGIQAPAQTSQSAQTTPASLGASAGASAPQGAAVTGGSAGTSSGNFGQ